MDSNNCTAWFIYKIKTMLYIYMYLYILFQHIYLYYVPITNTKCSYMFSNRIGLVIE